MTFPVKDKYVFINGLSGVVEVVSHETAQKFFDGEATPELKPFFTYLTPEEETEKAHSLCAFLLENAAKCVDGNVAITFDCNFRCPYCFEIWVKNPDVMKTVMDEYKVDKAFDALEILNKDCKKKKVVTLTGGEPLMRKNKDIVTYFLKKGKDLGYYFAIITNGMELNHFLPLLSSVDLDFVQITLDGPRSLHDRRRVFKKGEGTFDCIANNVDEARKMGIPLAIRTNIDTEVLSHLEELASFFTERGWAADPHIHFSLNALHDPHMEPEKAKMYMGLYEKAFAQVKRPDLNFLGVHDFIRHFRRLNSLCREPPSFWPAFWHCSAGIRRFVLDPFGDVHSCPSMVGWREQRIGVYIPELSFNEKHDQWQNRTIFTLEKCRNCNLLLVCGGECGYASLVQEKDLFTPVCTTTEKLVVDYLETFMGKLPPRPQKEHS